MTVKSKTLVTKEFQCVFPALTEPKGYEGKNPKYSVTGITDDKELMDEIAAFVTAAIEAMDWPQKAKAEALKRSLKNKDDDYFLFKSGDNMDLDKYPFFKGMKKFKVSKNPKFGPPAVYYPTGGQKPDPIPADLVQSEIYGGAWVRAHISCYCFKAGSKYGATLQLIELQKVREGEPFKQTSFSVIESSDNDLDEDASNPFED